MRRRAFEKDWTKGSIPGNLWALAWPMISSQGINQLVPLIDMVWVGRLGAASVAGVGIAFLAVQLINSLMAGLTTAARAMVARSMGANDAAGANHAAQQGFVVSAGFGAIVAVIGVLLTEPMLRLFGLEPDVVAEGAAYMRIIFIGSATMSFLQTNTGIMEASGDARTPLRITILYRLFHLLLAPFLTLGWWVFPRFGVSGAAMTNVIAQGLGLLISSWFLFSGGTRLRLSMKGFRLDPDILWRIVRVGLPASVTGMERTFANLVLMRILVPFGTAAVAAQGIVSRIHSTLIITPSAGFGRASGVLAGQNLGAGQPERAEKSGWLAASFANAYTMSFAGVALLWPQVLSSLFGSDPAMIEVTSDFLRIAAVGFLVLGGIQAFMDCMSGAGDTMSVMVITLVSMWFLEIPSAYFLSTATNLGVDGVRWSTSLAQVLRAIIYVSYFKIGKWKYKRV